MSTRVAAALTLAVLLGPLAAGFARAQDAGVHDFFRSIFGSRGPEPAAQVAPAPVSAPRRASPRPRQADRAGAREARAKPVRAARLQQGQPPSRGKKAPRAAYASLPESPAPEKVKLRTASNQAGLPGRVRSPAVDSFKALMTDPTLRRGDIVMFPDGPRVFTGTGRAPHTNGAFEDVRGTKALSRSNRRAVLAMRAPERTALPRPSSITVSFETPAAEAAPVLEARLETADPATAEVRSTPARVVYPAY